MSEDPRDRAPDDTESAPTQAPSGPASSPADAPTDVPTAWGAGEAKPSSGGAEGDAIGPYHLVRKIGEGGMGEVWIADQEKPIRRRVALKLIRGGMSFRAIVARFESERQAIAMMDHPNIAKIYDAGSTPDGVPYFVMEYVDGVPIDRHCDEHRLSTRARLELFMKVCEGVQHAHHKAIIHRDLKPSNVLVAVHDGRATPKIIDFGVAKALAAPLTEGSMKTEVGQIIGTPAYMSPEQADMSGRNIDTRTDVYSLGVMLYELLAGSLPLDTESSWKEGLESVLRTIRQVDPPRPSVRVSTAGEHSTDSAARRGTIPTALMRQLKGDLDWITMKALEKDPARRYGSPADLAADLRRHLDNEPVVARPPSTTYQMAKFVRRHTVAVGGAAVVAALLIVFAITMAVQAGRIARERDRANREAAAATQVSQFVTDLFKVSDPSEARGNSVTAREILDVGAGKIRETLSDQPEVQARLMATIGSVYANLGLYGDAVPLLEEALEGRRSTLGENDPSTLASMQELGILAYRQGRFEDADRLFSGALEKRRAIFGEGHPDTLDSMNSLANLYHRVGKYKESEPLYLAALEGQERVLGKDHEDTLKTMNNLSILYKRQQRYAEAEPLTVEALDRRRRLLGEDHPATVSSLQSLATLYIYLERYADAEARLKEALAIQRRVLGEDHPDTLVLVHNLGEVYRLQGRSEDAEPLLIQAHDARRAKLGDDHPYTLDSKDSLARLYQDQGRFGEAEAMFAAVVDARSRKIGPDNPDTLKARQAMIDLFKASGDAAKGKDQTGLLLASHRRLAEAPEADAAAKDTYARLLLTCDVEDLRDAAAALEFSRAANGMTGHAQPRLLDTLSLALFRTGDRAGAIENQQRALSLVPEGDEALRAVLEKTLAGFEGVPAASR